MTLSPRIWLVAALLVLLLHGAALLLVRHEMLPPPAPPAVTAEALAPVLLALRGAASPRRWRGYQRTLRWRGWDLACYWARLPIRQKAGFFGNMVRWLRVR